MKLTVATVVTGLRLGFFAVFIWAAQVGLSGLIEGAFIFAWGLDAVDGWLARRLRQETDFGYVFDKATDRLVLFGGILVLLAYGLVPVYVIVVLVKDIVVLPAVGTMYIRGQRVKDMGKMGKLVAFLQGISIVWALLGWGGLVVLVTLVALVGGLVASRYNVGVFREIYGKTRAAI
jgi:phosphatidylglycerophosphate synthase